MHDYRRQLIKDIPHGRRIYLILRKRRYRCTCGRRYFEKNTFLPRYYRATKRLIAAIISAFENVLSAEMIACHYNVSCATAMSYFRCVSPKLKKLPEVLSVDEFKGNVGGEKYNTILVDPKNKRVLDILPNRYESHLIRCFKQFDSRKKVKHFVCDMNPHFHNISKVCFPKAEIVADRYHVICQVYWVMERVRKHEQDKLSPHFRKYFKRSRSLLMKTRGKLKPNEMNALALIFESFSATRKNRAEAPRLRPIPIFPFFLCPNY